jgi:hypothetical protein
MQIQASYHKKALILRLTVSQIKRDESAETGMTEESGEGRIEGGTSKEMLKIPTLKLEVLPKRSL